MSKKDYYLSECEKMSHELKRLCFEEKGWELKKDSKTCKVFCIPSTQGQGFTWRGEGIVAVKPEKLIDMVHPTEKYRLQWDPNVASCRLLEELSPNSLIAHTVMKAHLLGLLSARDTIDVFKLEETDTYISSQFGGVEYENGPVEKDAVRAWSYPSGIFFLKGDVTSDKGETGTKVITFFQADARLDVVPPAMLNAAMPTFIKNYFKALRKTADIQWTPLVDVPGRRKA